MLLFKVLTVPVLATVHVLLTHTPPVITEVNISMLFSTLFLQVKFVGSKHLVESVQAVEEQFFPSLLLIFPDKPLMQVLLSVLMHKLVFEQTQSPFELLTNSEVMGIIAPVPVIVQVLGIQTLPDEVEVNTSILFSTLFLQVKLLGSKQFDEFVHEVEQTFPSLLFILPEAPEIHV